MEGAAGYGHPVLRPGPPVCPPLQAELKAEKQRRFAELDWQQQRRLGDERAKLGRLAALQLAPGPVRRRRCLVGRGP